jgi:hypothetical protein
MELDIKVLVLIQIKITSKLSFWRVYNIPLPLYDTIFGVEVLILNTCFLSLLKPCFPTPTPSECIAIDCIVSVHPTRMFQHFPFK